MIMTLLDWVEGCSDSRTPEEHSRPTPLKHLRFREADRLPDQALNARPQGEMLALDFLRVAFAWAVLVGVEVTRVGTPVG